MNTIQPMTIKSISLDQSASLFRQAAELIRVADKLASKVGFEGTDVTSLITGLKDTADLLQAESEA